MDIVIVGAGQTGRHIAALLSQDEHNITIIDPDPQRLELAAYDSDIATRYGSGTDWQILEELTEYFPEILLAFTPIDEINLIACDIAKNLGYPRTVARIRKDSFLNNSRLDICKMFSVDHIIAPEKMVAHNIFKYIMNPGAAHVETFAFGAAQMRTMIIPETWRHNHVKLADLELPTSVMVGLIYRRFQPKDSKSKGQVIFPHGQETIQPLDEVTIIGETDQVLQAHQFFGISQKPTHSVIIAGGSLVAVHLARILEERGVTVRLIEKDYARCVELSETLPNTIILHHNATDLNFLRSQRLEAKDVFVSCTRHDEMNLMLGLLAKQCGCHNVIITTTAPEHEGIVLEYEIGHTLSAQTIVANKILSIVHSKNVTSVVSLYDGAAEVAEIKISADSKIAGIPTTELDSSLPKDFLIGVIQRHGRIITGRENKVLSPGDTAIVITHPHHLGAMQGLF